MNNYLQSLIDYIQKEKITFREEGDQPCLDSIWWHYGECYNLDNPAAKEGFCNLRARIDGLSAEDADTLITEVGCLCAEYERIAFTAGLRLGAQLMLEITTEKQLAFCQSLFFVYSYAVFEGF